MRMTPSVSIIVPCRNDAAALGRTPERLEGMGEAEVVVGVSGDAEGAARAAAGRAGLLRPGSSTRAALMNAGAAEARGNVLFFLVHATAASHRDPAAN